MFACAQGVVFKLLAKADTSICLMMVGPDAEVCTCVCQQRCERLLVAAVASTDIHNTGGHHAVHATPLFCTKQNRHNSELSAKHNHVSWLPLADLAVGYFRASISQTEQTCSG